MKVILVYLMKIILSVPDEGYFERAWWRLFWAYQMKVIERTWWRLLSIPDEGYYRNVSSTLNFISTFLLMYIFFFMDFSDLLYYSHLAGHYIYCWQ